MILYCTNRKKIKTRFNSFFSKCRIRPGRCHLGYPGGHYDKKYALKFKGRLGEEAKYKGRILGVGIAYDKNTKKHQCKIEILREALK